MIPRCGVVTTRVSKQARPYKGRCIFYGCSSALQVKPLGEYYHILDEDSMVGLRQTPWTHQQCVGHIETI
jgi:hypothetical protein